MATTKGKLPDKSRGEMVTLYDQISGMEPSPKRDLALKNYGRLVKMLETQYDVPHDQQGPIDWLLKAGMKGMDYTSGLARLPINLGLAVFGGQPEYAKEIAESSINPFTTRPAPGVGEVMSHVGIPEGGRASDLPGADAVYNDTGEGWKLQRGGPLDPTARGTAGFGLDMAASPGGYKALRQLFSKAPVEARSAAKIMQDRAEAAQNPPSRMSEFANIAVDPLGELQARLGKAAHRSVFQPLDDALKPGMTPISQIAFENNVAGTGRQIRNGLGKVETRLGNEVQNLETDLYNLQPHATYPRSEVLDRASKELDILEGTAGQTKAARKARSRLYDEFDETYGPDQATLLNPEPKTRFDVNELKDTKRSYQAKARDQRAYVDEPPSPGRGANAADNLADARAMGDAYKYTAERARRGVEIMGDRIGDAQYIADRTPVPRDLGGKIFTRNDQLASLAEAGKEIRKFGGESLGESLRRGGPSAAISATVGATPAYLLSARSDPFTIGLAAAAAAGASTRFARSVGGLGLAKSAPYTSPALRSYLMEKYAPELRTPGPWDEEYFQ